MSAILFDLDKAGVATLTLNRPERHNSFDDASTTEFMAHLDRCVNDHTVRLVCIRANGRNFCAGADVGSLPGKDAEPSSSKGAPSLLAMLRRLNQLTLPSVALVQGACVGGGAALVACCDVAIAERSAYLAISEVRLGIPPVALVPYFAAAIGVRHTRRYALSGEKIDAQRCLDIGFVHEICDQGGLSAAASPIVEAFLRGGPLAIGRTKAAALLLAPPEMSPEEEAVFLERMKETIASPEAVEGISAFLEKRAPRWFKEV